MNMEQVFEWAQVEVFGHRRHFGRIEEVERFGTKMLRIDVPTDDPTKFDTLLYGGASIFSIALCTEEIARAWADHCRPRPIARIEAPPAQNRDDDRYTNEGGPF